MAKQTRLIRPPTGVSRFFYRLPIWLYRQRLGWMMGNRFVLLNHIGRKSGQVRQVVLEVVKYEPDSRELVVCAGFGPKSQWYQNLLAQPEVSIQLGSRKWEAAARQLTPDEGGKVLRDFAKSHPGEAKFAGVLGFEVDGTIDDYYDMGRQMIFMGLSPRS